MRALNKQVKVINTLGSSVEGQPLPKSRSVSRTEI